MGQLNHAVFTAVNQVDGGCCRGALWQSRKAAVKGNHTRDQSGLCFHALQRHNRPLRETNQRGCSGTYTALLLPVAYGVDKGRHDGIDACLTILFRHALHGKPLTPLWATRLYAANADDECVGENRRKPAADLPHIHCIITDAMKQQQQLLRWGRRALDNKMVMFHGSLLN
ncbi:hypothetical protein D3C72_447550 [compost metagenome]